MMKNQAMEELLANLVKSAGLKGVPLEALLRASSDPSTLNRLLTVAYDDWLQKELGQPEAMRQAGLPSGHFRMHVSYGFVSESANGREWTLHPSCRRIDRTPGERIFYLHEVGPNWASWNKEDQIRSSLLLRSNVAPNGYRPATFDEAYEFRKVAPTWAGSYVALGACSKGVGKDSYIYAGSARVWDDDSHRDLLITCFALNTKFYAPLNSILLVAA